MTPDTDAVIVALAKQGHGIRRIVTETGLSNYAVRKAMARLGVKGKTGRRAAGTTCPTCGGTGRVTP